MQILRQLSDYNILNIILVSIPVSNCNFQAQLMSIVPKFLWTLQLFCPGWYVTWCVLFLWQQINIDIYFCRRNSDICSSARLKTIPGHPPGPPWAFDHVYDPRGGEFEPNTLLGHLYGQIYILRLQDRGIWWEFASQGRRYGEFGHQEWKKSNARGRPGGMCRYRFDSCIMVQIVSFVISSKLLWFTVCFQLHWSASATIFKQLYRHNKQFNISWKSQVLYEWNIVLMDNAQCLAAAQLTNLELQGSILLQSMQELWITNIKNFINSFRLTPWSSHYCWL